MRVTVEGVETEEQVAFLDCSHADLVQGYFFGRPIPSTEVARTILAQLQESRERQQKSRIDSAPQAEAAA
jgi:EAL domain-containing protein (putative c-di-GMP-specific phosphodiesterase class I)